MSLKQILLDYGVSSYQAITIIPVLITIINAVSKVLKKPFSLINLISRNKFLNLSIKERNDAIETIYQIDNNQDKHKIILQKTKLASYGLNYPVHTLQITFEYLISINKLNELMVINGFLKHYKIFYVCENTLPIICCKELCKTVVVVILFLIFSFFGLIVGFKVIGDFLILSLDLILILKLILISFSEIWFFSVTIALINELTLIYSAMTFAKKLSVFSFKKMFKSLRKK